jgi:glycosyltransferase involved in cell wall biosynthesis
MAELNVHGGATDATHVAMAHRTAVRKAAGEFTVVHLVPALFDARDGIIGGAERYSFELARHMSDRVHTRLVTFGAEARRQEVGRLEIVVLDAHLVRGQRSNPIAATLPGALRDAAVVHCHQQHVVASSFAAVFARVTRRRVFVTDLGGGGLDVSSFVSTDAWFHGHLHISEYSRRVSGHSEFRKARVILGGVDTTRFTPGGRKTDGVLFVGRILPHKGIHDLIDAVPPDMPLRIVGKVADDEYLQSLVDRGRGRRITFVHDADDRALVEEYRRAACVVLPSVYTTPDGHQTKIPELLGQTLLEAMACGRPVICTDVASLPEIVVDGEHGFVVPPADPRALRHAIEKILVDPIGAAAMGQAGRQRVLERFQWAQVVDRCLDAYAAA